MEATAADGRGTVVFTVGETVDMTTSYDPDDQESEALRAEHVVIYATVDAMEAVVERWPDETSMEEILSSIFANLMLKQKDPLKWLEKVSNLAWKKRNIFWKAKRH